MKRERPTDKPPLGTFKKRTALSPDEERLFHALNKAAGNAYYVFPKMAMHEIIQNTRTEDFHRYSSKSIDFMIYQTSTFYPICALELDDPYHDTKTNREHDAVKDFILETAGIPIVRLDVSEKFHVRMLRDLILNAEPRKNPEYPIMADIVEVETVLESEHEPIKQNHHKK